MSGSIRLYGSTSGYVELKAPDVAGDNIVDLGAVPTVDSTPSDGQVLTWNASLSKWEAKDLKMKEKRIAAFTGSGTWTVPAGVTYAIAHMMGGGGGAGGASVAGTAGGTSSVAFAGGTVQSLGGQGGPVTASGNNNSAFVGRANSGRGGLHMASVPSTGNRASASPSGMDSQWAVAGDTVTPAASITVTVGNGGAGGDANAPAGGSGYVYIEYYEEV